MGEKGILYYATGQQYLDEATVSARSVKAAMPSMPIILFTNLPEAASKVFDEVREVENHPYPFLNRISAFKQSPFERTLFLDSDTFVTTDISDMFTLLDRFDIATANIPGHIPDREIRASVSDYVPDVPESFPEFNCGVLLFKNTEKIQRMFTEWEGLYGQHVDDVCDQEPFREILWKSDLRIHVLPPEYNCRFPFPGAVMGTVKILHGRHPNMEAMAARMNQEKGLRAYTGDAHRRIISHPKPPVTIKYPGPGRTRHALNRLRTMASEQGWRETIRETWKRAPRLLR